ncbi:hypothetical protein B0H17DRAFT_1143130 [Mycena rosella]|uniref:Uncharacterized protein n=1 Tax=Mycena rosella TaxID=1033263 RepID=A0AAD7CW72_MYCRO|nr:hypothetical protein B0H17DRAFT_1143130 [Mycena rosella]
MSAQSEVATATLSRNSPSPVSSGIKIVINTQGPGSFTFNINISGSSAQATSIIVNSLGTEPEPVRLSRSNSRTVGVPETPPGSPTSDKDHGKSQTVEAPVTPRAVLMSPHSSQSEGPDTDSDTGDEDTWEYHNAEPVAKFSLHCQLVSPSLKRKYRNMPGDGSFRTTGLSRSNILFSAPLSESSPFGIISSGSSGICPALFFFFAAIVKQPMEVGAGPKQEGPSAVKPLIVSVTDRR